MVQLLLDRGVEPSIADHTGRTPLDYGATKGHLDVVQILLDRGAEPNMVDQVM